MLSNLRLIYWDSCVPLSYINGYNDRLPHLEGLLQRSGKDHQLITSIYSVAEVAFAKVEQDKKVLDKNIEEKLSTLWLAGSPILLVEFYQLIAVKAATLIRAGISEGWSLKPGDAIHLATADHLKVSEFQTYDDRLNKFGSLTETKFKICRPSAQQPVMILSSESEQLPKSEEESRPEAAIEAENKEELEESPAPQKIAAALDGTPPVQSGAGGDAASKPAAAEIAKQSKDDEEKKVQP